MIVTQMIESRINYIHNGSVYLVVYKVNRSVVNIVNGLVGVSNR